MNSAKLIRWFEQNKRDLPWRHTKDPYKIWLSEIILQQTRVAQGLPYYIKFIKQFPDVYALANSDEQEVLKLWQGLGYYTRARNLHHTAKEIVHRYNGRFPSTYAKLLQLKGVGEYTAAAIASFCFDQAVPVIDGNVFRVLSRLKGIAVPINTSEGKKIFKITAAQSMDTSQPARYNQAVMEFGALQCLPQQPLCKTCPLQTECVAYQTGKVERLPVKLPKIKIKKRTFHFVLVYSNDKILLQKRQNDDIWKNLYQLPLIETPNQKSPSNNDWKLFYDKWQITPEHKPEHLSQTNHKLTHQHLNIHFWKLKTTGLSLQAVDIKQLKLYPLPVVIANFLDNYNL